MKPQNNGTILIINSLLWAAAMIGTALVLAGTEYYEKVSLLLLFLWFASFLTLQGNRKSLKEEWACIRQFFS